MAEWGMWTMYVCRSSRPAAAAAGAKRAAAATAKITHLSPWHHIVSERVKVRVAMAMVDRNSGFIESGTR